MAAKGVDDGRPTFACVRLGHGRLFEAAHRPLKTGCLQALLVAEVQEVGHLLWRLRSVMEIVEQAVQDLLALAGFFARCHPLDAGDQRLAQFLEGGLLRQADVDQVEDPLLGGRGESPAADPGALVLRVPVALPQGLADLRVVQVVPSRAHGGFYVLEHQVVVSAQKSSGSMAQGRLVSNHPTASDTISPIASMSACDGLS